MHTKTPQTPEVGVGGMERTWDGPGRSTPQTIPKPKTDHTPLKIALCGESAANKLKGKRSAGGRKYLQPMTQGAFPY